MKNKSILGVIMLAAIITAGLIIQAHITQAQTTAALVPPTSTISVDSDNKVLVSSAKVTSIDGTTINAVNNWGNTNLAWVIKTDASTEFLRHFGAKSSLSEMTVGDFISFRGSLDTSASQLTITATRIRNWSIQEVNGTFMGAVKSTDSNGKSFVMTTESRGDLTVFVLTDTKIITDNDAQSIFTDLRVGQNVTARGVWDRSNTNLQADRVVIHIANVPVQRDIFQGVIKSAVDHNADLPTSMVVTIDNRDITVNVTSDTRILNKNWTKAPLADFKADDTIRIYGAPNSDNATIDALVVRDISI